MNKVKSAICLTLITILILGVAFMATVSFSYGPNQMYTFNSILSELNKGALIGNELQNGQDSDNYLGGGYYAVYYPEGVITVKEYEDTRAAKTGDDKDKYEKSYLAYPAEGEARLYLKVEENSNDENCVVTKTGEEKAVFTEKFEDAVAQLTKRVEALRMEDARISIRNKYCVQIYVPTPSTSANTSTPAAIFNYFGKMGKFDVGYGSSADSATRLSSVFADDETVADYVKSAHYTYNNGNYVTVDFTSAGLKELQSWTLDAASTAVTVYFFIGDEMVANVSLNATVTRASVTFGGNFTAAAARALSSSINTAIGGTSDLSFTLGDVYHTPAQFGDLALVLMYAAFGGLFLAMMIFFFIRYKGLAIAHLYSFVIYTLVMILLIWAISSLGLSVWTFLAVLLGGALLTVSNAVAYEKVRKEYKTGKTMETAVKTGYKKCFWGVFDLHVALAILAFITFAIALTQLASFALTLGIAVLVSALCTIAVNRFHWLMLRTFAKDPAAFCNFGKGVEDDE